MSNKDLLIEIGVEELPTAAVTALPEAGAQFLSKALGDEALSFEKVEFFGTPRRLAWRVRDLQERQAEREQSRRGPALAAAKNADGSWSKAALGFARSCGVTPEDLGREETPQGQWLAYRSVLPGKTIEELLPDLFAALIKSLPIAKYMRWSDHAQGFVRPVLNLLVMYGEARLPLEFFGVSSTTTTPGHPVHHPQAVTLRAPADYEQALLNAHVMVSHAERMKKIAAAVQALAEQENALAVMPEALLAEVASLTEWPVAVLGHFEERFLQVPQEVLITTMQDNQKYFALTDHNGRLKNAFIAIANIESTAPEIVRHGNERVIRPRFADAEFFWQQDCKHAPQDWFAGLEHVVNQKKLGSMADKSRRIAALAVHLAEMLHVDAEQSRQAALLAKCDLQSEMVMEFPELQGIMGRYYAERAGYPSAVARAIEQQYWPKGSGGALPEAGVPQCLSLADKLETLLGGFAIGARPTGTKDPFALRRMSIGILRILLQAHLDVDLRDLIAHTARVFPAELKVEEYSAEVLDYLLDRLKVHFQEQGSEYGDCFNAVRAIACTRPCDMQRRIEALARFTTRPEAEILLAAAKRIHNILRKETLVHEEVRQELFVEAAEGKLWNALQASEVENKKALATKDYSAALSSLAQLKDDVDQYFEDVMVMAEDAALRRNRLAVLQRLQRLMQSVADLSEVQAACA